MNRPAEPASFTDLRAWDLIRPLIAFDTTSRESNLALIEWVRSWLGRLGVESALSFDDEGRKANLFATVPAHDGNATTGGIVLSGHTDVVPVDGQPWATDPFAATIAGDRLYGRGTADMKGFCAAALAVVPELLGRRLARPVHLALSYDEEVGCIGAQRLLDDIARRGVRPAGCIVGEPTGMQVIVAHKGRKTWRCRVRGHEAHSSVPTQGVNAVEIACEIVAYLVGLARGFRDQGAFDVDYDVPYTTVHCGMIRGGTAANIVPRDCWFDFEVRHLPMDDPDALLAEVDAYARRFLPDMHAVAPDTFIEFETQSALPGFDTHAESEIAVLGKTCTLTAGHGKVSFGTEAALFHRAEIPTIICGPGHIAQAHQPDEWIALEQLVQCEAFLQRLTDRISLP